MFLAKYLYLTCVKQKIKKPLPVMGRVLIVVPPKLKATCITFTLVPYNAGMRSYLIGQAFCTQLKGGFQRNLFGKYLSL
jgi:hypothetical protein